MALLLLAGTLTSAEGAKLSDVQRATIVHIFLAERPFLHRTLPQGKGGIRIEDGKITPSEAEMNQWVVEFGPVAAPGERVQITAVRFEHGGVVFEINGGPNKRKGWRERLSGGVNGSDPRSPQSPADTDSLYTHSNGSSVFLAIKSDDDAATADQLADQLKDMISPILDFKTLSVAEAKAKRLPPLLAEAIKKHRALVGMDKDLVTDAIGRPPRRLRENRDGKEYEEWIYGNPPHDVQFIRFLGDKVVSIEEMKVSGEKVVRTQDEVGDLNASAKKQTLPGAMSSNSDATEQRTKPPTLLRPGEKTVNADDRTRDSKPDSNPKLPPEMSPPPPNLPN